MSTARSLNDGMTNQSHVALLFMQHNFYFVTDCFRVCSLLCVVRLSDGSFDLRGETWLNGRYQIFTASQM